MPVPPCPKASSSSGLVFSGSSTAFTSFISTQHPDFAQLSNKESYPFKRFLWASTNPVKRQASLISKGELLELGKNSDERRCIKTLALRNQDHGRSGVPKMTCLAHQSMKAARAPFCTQANAPRYVSSNPVPSKINASLLLFSEYRPRAWSRSCSLSLFLLECRSTSDRCDSADCSWYTARASRRSLGVGGFRVGGLRRALCTGQGCPAPVQHFAHNLYWHFLCHFLPQFTHFRDCTFVGFRWVPGVLSLGSRTLGDGCTGGQDTAGADVETCSESILCPNEND